MATPVANGASSEPNVSSQKLGTPGQNPAKSSFAAKVSEGNRKPDEDASQRRAAQPKAWTSGVNPITQRSNSSLQMNGAGGKSANAAEKCMDRQAWMFSNSVGLECILTLKSCERFTGVFAGAQRAGESQKLVFKMVKQLVKDGPVEIASSSIRSGEYCGEGYDHTMVFAISSMELFEVPQAPTAGKAGANGASSAFRTDTDISGNLAMRERNLQRWEAPAGQDAGMSLESSAGVWDQFKANEVRFGLKSDYDENIYTTTIDRQNPQYAKRALEAERIAREIERDTAGNSHVREERGLADEALDEEDKYSGVSRSAHSLHSNQPNRYVPPSKRGQTPTTSSPSISSSINTGVDPAIISAQMARPEVAETKKAVPQPVAAPAAGLTIKTSAVPSTDGKPAKLPGKVAGALATDNVESELLDSFRQFAASEKIKVQDHKRTRASQDKAVKMNDLKKFSQNFKLLTPVPKDLVPILAKDENKQKEIVQKAQANAESKPTKAAIATTDQKSNRLLTTARWENENVAPSTSPASRNRQSSATPAALPKERNAPRDNGQPIRGPQGSLSTRLDDNHRAYMAGVPAQIPKAVPIPDNRNKNTRGSGFPAGQPSPQKSMSRGPPSATSQKFNVKAMEFNPNANAFKPNMGPSTVASSPRSGLATRAISPAAPAPNILRDRKDFSALGGKNPLTQVLEKPAEPSATGAPGVDVQAAAKAIVLNGGFPAAYRTAPTWQVEDPENGPDRKAVYDERRPKRLTTPQPHASPSAALAHQYQLPPHLQQGIHGAPSSAPPQHNHQQPHAQHHQYNHGPHYEENHMRPSASNSSYAPSPRMQNNTAYQSPMPPHAQLAYPQHMHGYPAQGHPMGGRQFSNPGPPQMMPVPQGGHLAPMMIPQGQGSYGPPQMGMPFAQQGMPMYPSPGPHPMYGSAGQPPNGYPSPGRGAPMMMHQGSQQGQQPVYMPQQHGQFGQPVYAQQPPHMGMRGGFGSPQPPFAQNSYPQPQQYPHQPHRTPSSGYTQPHQPHHQHVQPQQGPPPQPTGPVDTSDEAK